MTSEESRGRKITLGIALFLAVPSLLVLIVLLLTGTAASRIPWFQVVLQHGSRYAARRWRRTLGGRQFCATT